MNELIAKVEQWAHERNIINGSKPIDQAMKLFSEFGELADNVGKGRDCRDDIGDVLVVLIIMARQLGLDVIRAINTTSRVELKTAKNGIIDLGLSLNYFSRSENQQTLNDCLRFLFSISYNLNVKLVDCLQIAYDDIRTRKGIMYNGVFVKDTDENYTEIKAKFDSSMENNFG